jgi:penicillin-binding protein 1C
LETPRRGRVCHRAAALRNLRNGRVISGASTITQQLIKISSARRERTLAGKIREGFAALRLEREWEKKRILEAYLNRLDYGNRRFGPEAAAQAYFGKSARLLSFRSDIPGRSASIAGAVEPLEESGCRPGPLPSQRQAARRGRASSFRRHRAVALRAPPRIEMHEPTSEASHFVQLVQRGVSPDLTASGKITTYLDSNLQNIALRALREHLSRNAGLGVTDAAIVVIENSTGAVRALAGAGDPRHAALNSAVEPRSCGSTLKPFLYLLALDQRKLTAASLLPDTKDAIAGEYRDYDPQNYSKRYLGRCECARPWETRLTCPRSLRSAKLAPVRPRLPQQMGPEFSGSFDAYGADSSWECAGAPC